MSAWIDQIFEADIAKDNGVVRRAKAWVQQLGSHEEFLVEVRKRGFHLIETGEQYVVLCNPGALKIYC
jgi:hypothetical protein